MSAESPQYPREQAIRIIAQVLTDRIPLEDALERAFADIPTPQHRAWLQENCSGVLRWRGRLDGIIDSIALTKKPSGWMRRALLVAAYQLCAQDRTNPGRVVSETVAAVKKKDGEAPARFVNALLRKVSAHAAEWRALAPPPKLASSAGAQWASMPEWLWARLIRDHGETWAVEFAKASLERPKVWVRARDQAWAEAAKDSLIAGSVPESYVSDLGGAVPQWPGFKEGAFFVQDISSQLLVHDICQEALSRRKGAAPIRALDLCAAPGGKTAGMAWSGIQVTATDRDEKRLELLRENVARIQATNVKVVSRAELAPLELQDLVWVDAPCSGTGIIRRHPDVRWVRQEGELAGLSKTQDQVIRDGWSKLKPGGLFVYSVCSVLKEEGIQAWERAKFPAQVLKTWFLSPQDSPHGDGFWAIMVESRQ